MFDWKSFERQIFIIGLNFNEVTQIDKKKYLLDVRSVIALAH